MQGYSPPPYACTEGVMCRLWLGPWLWAAGNCSVISAQGLPGRACRSKSPECLPHYMVRLWGLIGVGDSPRKGLPSDG